MGSKKKQTLGEALVARSLYVRYTDAKGNVRCEEHRVFGQPDRVVADLYDNTRKDVTLEVIDRDTFDAWRFSKKQRA